MGVKEICIKICIKIDKKGKFRIYYNTKSSNK